MDDARGRRPIILPQASPRECFHHRALCSPLHLSRCDPSFALLEPERLGRRYSTPEPLHRPNEPEAACSKKSCSYVGRLFSRRRRPRSARSSLLSAPADNRLASIRPAPPSAEAPSPKYPGLEPPARSCARLTLRAGRPRPSTPSWMFFASCVPRHLSRPFVPAKPGQPQFPSLGSWRSDSWSFSSKLRRSAQTAKLPASSIPDGRGAQMRSPLGLRASALPL